ncbi:F-box protein At2g23160-like [Apium graveolens]|uniref:F-box protein At2g23160-like n=1 Tax=Apium graveolens TaxID=4045 RepID=UPI003D7A4DC3
MEGEAGKRSKTTIACIHDSIFIKILCYLAADSVIRCRSVCKNWASLILSPDFVQAYSSSQTVPFQFLLHGTVGVIQEHRQLFFAHLSEASCNADTPRFDYPVPINSKSVLPPALEIKSSPHELRICSVCNITGFIAAYAYPCRRDDLGHPYHIFNPVTSQHIVVQQNRKNECWKKCALVLAHKTNQLKLLKSVRQPDRDLLIIQTIGTSSWRTGVCSLLHNVVNFGFPCFLNGIYYWGWSCSNNGGLVCFDPDDEAFFHIPTPQSPYIENYHHAYLGLLDGCLCICKNTSSVNVNDYEFWVMNENGVTESWTKKLVIPKQWEQITLSRPLRFWKYGETVVLCDNYDVICYNPSTGNRTFVTYYAKDDSLLSCVPSPYVPTFKIFLCS